MVIVAVITFNNAATDAIKKCFNKYLGNGSFGEKL
jgi:hypothetical protein